MNGNTSEKIIRVICPHCGYEMSEQENVVRISFNGYARNKYWACNNCVYIYTNVWFNDKNMMHCEKFVLRENDDLIAWKKNLKKDKDKEKVTLRWGWSSKR